VISLYCYHEHSTCSPLALTHIMLSYDDTIAVLHMHDGMVWWYGMASPISKQSWMLCICYIGNVSL